MYGFEEPEIRQCRKERSDTLANRNILTVEPILFTLASVGGEVTGAMAAKAIMGDPKPYTGGGIEGVTTTKIPKGKGQEKNQKMADIPQAEISQAYKWFDQAANEQESFIKQGLGFYTAAMQNSANEVVHGYTSANETLRPMSESIVAAMNQQMRMLGLDPVQATSGYGGLLRNSVAALSDTPEGVQQFAQDLSQKMDQASNLRDPNERAAAKNQILDIIGTANTKFIDPLKEQLDNVKTTLEPYHDLDWESFAKGIKGTSGANGTKMIQYQAALAADKADYNKRVADDIASQKAVLQQRIDQGGRYINSLTNMGTDFSNKYGANYDAGYTGQQVSDAITATPGYQFTVDQGRQVLARQAASMGVLDSGNTAISVQEHGRNMALSYYNDYMAQLSGVAQFGSQATMQIAANQGTLGGNLADIQASIGNAENTAYTNIGGARANSLFAKANAYIDVAKFNTGLQFARQTQNIANEQKDKSDAMAAMPGIMAATNQANQLAYQQQQGQQMAQAFNGGGGGIGGTYVGVGGAVYSSTGGGHPVRANSNGYM